MKKYRIISEDRLEELVAERSRDYAQKTSQSYQQELLKRQVYMKALQNQINPHFLYNTLECIRGQALLYDAKEIADTAQTLSRFFRYSINTSSDIVTLRDELSNVKDYMKIQQYRFKDRFYLTVNVEDTEEDLLLARIPKLTFQPIVENAITHAFTDKLKFNNISIEIKASSRHIRIVISDDGKGIEEPVLKKLNRELQDQDLSGELENGAQASPSDSHNGIALGNVNQRIKLYFGAEYGLSVTSVPGMGTDVVLYIPQQMRDED